MCVSISRGKKKASHSHLEKKFLFYDAKKSYS
jgi:hypothetical protein